mmetsp:Transcript_3537/g.7508  ORF Transcript_3537/g.7508 Transcript_3537/m.7508 type:complete len:152 (+) Transcript_3537:2882-3337(+)
MSVKPNRATKLQFQWSSSTPEKAKLSTEPSSTKAPETISTKVPETSSFRVYEAVSVHEKSPLQRSISEARDIVRKSRSRQTVDDDIIMQKCLEGLHSAVGILEQFSIQMNDLAKNLNATADQLRKGVSALTDSPYYQRHEFPHPQRLYSPS